MPHIIKKKNNPGFTLVEMLIVAAMLSVVSLAVYAVFNSGTKIWDRVNTQAPEEDLNIFFDKFTTDLKNSFKFTGIDFLGREDEFEFSTLVSSQRLNKKTVGQVVYSYDPMKKTLNREQRDFSQVYNEENGPITISLKDVTRLKFQYYFYDDEAKEYYWLDEWFEKTLPLAVRIELVLNGGKQSTKFTKTVTIPASG